jgi:hypothetical protein
MIWCRGGDYVSERERNRVCQANHREHWVVLQRYGNASAFKADYVYALPDAKEGER